MVFGRMRWIVFNMIGGKKKMIEVSVELFVGEKKREFLSYGFCFFI